MTISRSSSRLLLLVLLLVCGPRLGWARQHGTFEEHYGRAVELYKEGEYAGAIDEFQAAYSIKQLPKLLLNLGQAHRKLGHAKEALGYYEFYLRVEPNPKPELRAELDGYIAQSKALIDAAERAKKQSQEGETQARTEQGAPPAGAEQPSSQAAPPAPRPDLTPRPTPQEGNAIVASAPPPRRPVYKKWWFWTAIAAGVVVAGGVAAGVVLGTRPQVPAWPLESAR